MQFLPLNGRNMLASTAAQTPGYFTYKEYVIPTSINAMPEESGKAQDEVWYNLQGVRIDNPAKGIYILNGKKVVRK